MYVDERSHTGKDARCIPSESWALSITSRPVDFPQVIFAVTDPLTFSGCALPNLSRDSDTREDSSSSMPTAARASRLHSSSRLNGPNDTLRSTADLSLYPAFAYHSSFDLAYLN